MKHLRPAIVSFITPIAVWYQHNGTHFAFRADAIMVDHVDGDHLKLDVIEGLAIQALLGIQAYWRCTPATVIDVRTANISAIAPITLDLTSMLATMAGPGDI